MRRESFQEISDDILIEKIASDIEIVKMAGLFESLGLDGAASKIKASVQRHIGDADSMDAVLDTIKDLLITGTLFKIHPVIGVGYAMATSVFGIDVAGMVGNVIDAIRGKGGKPLSEAEFNSIAKSAMLAPDLLIKEAQWRKNAQRSPTIPFFGGHIGRGSRYRKPSVIQSVFGNLFKSGKWYKAGWLAKGLVMWTLKTALLGAGLLFVGSTVAGAAKHLHQGADEEVTEVAQEQPEQTGVATQKPVVPSTPAVPTNKWKSILLTPAHGYREQRWKNNDEDVWIIDLAHPSNGGSIQEMLLRWTKRIYPELGKMRSILPSFPSSKLSKEWRGIPTFVESDNCVAAVVSDGDWNHYPDVCPTSPMFRGQWARQVASSQWNCAEMRDGSAWEHLKKFKPIARDQ